MTIRYVWPDPFDPKRPGEVDVFGCQFVRRLYVAETIESSLVKCVLKDDATETNITSMVVGTPSVLGTVVSQMIDEGVEMTWYTLIFRVTTSTGRTLETARDFQVASRWDNA